MVELHCPFHLSDSCPVPWSSEHRDGFPEPNCPDGTWMMLVSHWWMLCYFRGECLHHSHQYKVCKLLQQGSAMESVTRRHFFASLDDVLHIPYIFPHFQGIIEVLVQWDWQYPANTMVAQLTLVSPSALLVSRDVPPTPRISWSLLSTGQSGSVLKPGVLQGDSLENSEVAFSLRVLRILQNS